MDKRSVVFLFIITLLLHALPLWWHYSDCKRSSSTFAINPVSMPANNSQPRMVEEFIDPDFVAEMVHVSSICELRNGGLAAVWYGGTREGSKDTAIFLSTYGADNKTTWSKPEVIVDRKSASQELNRYVKKIGNSIIFTDSKDRLWLVYVTIAFGGWSGSSLNFKISYDGGINWTDTQRINLSPFFNVSELVRNNPVLLNNNDFVIPIYHECLGRFPEILWVKNGNKENEFHFRKTRMAGGRSFIQPSIVAYEPYLATAFYRNLSSDRKIAISTTRDAGHTWSEPQYLKLPNPDSGINVVHLSNGLILMAFNDSRENRENLSLAISDDSGHNWRHISTIENTQGEEFSYPYMIQTSDKSIHLVYTWQRRHIKHLAFNEPWIDMQIKGTKR